MFGNPRFQAWPREIWLTLFRVWGFFWLLMILTEVSDAMGDADFRWWKPVAFELSSMVMLSVTVYLMLDHGMRNAHLLATPRRWFWEHFKWLPAISTVFVLTVYGFRHAFLALLDVEYRHGSWAGIWGYETMKISIFLGLWIGVFYGIHVFVAARAQERNLQTLQRALTEARLQQLKAQLEPHFLFNTLNTISSLMHNDVAAADRLLNQLGDLLRARLTFDDRQVVTLEEELRLLRLYADIMCTRFAPRVEMEWHIEHDALAIDVPVMLLQPLLENVFRHEVETTSERVQVSIEARRSEGTLEVTVRNSVSNTLYRLPGAGIGLNNSRERLLALYGGAATLTAAAEGNTFGATLRVPETLPGQVA